MAILDTYRLAGGAYVLDTQATSGTSTVTMVSVTPGTATGSQQFTATVVGTNSPSQSVTWATNAGSINSTGYFTAPAQTASVQTITITATSTQDGTKSGTATATIAAIGSTVTSVTVSPTNATGSQQFTATVTGTGSPSQSVNWTTTAGAISTSGYLTIPQTGVIQVASVTATSTQDGTYSATAVVNVPAAVIVVNIQGSVEDIGYSGTVRSITWSGLSQANPNGGVFQWVEYVDRSITITGVFSGGSITIQGSNDNVTWFPLHDTSNAEATTTIPKLSQLMELTHYVRPVVTTASGLTNLTVILVMRRNWK